MNIEYFCIIDKKYLMAPSLKVMVREVVVVSAHGCLYLLMHCTVGALRASILTK